MAKTEPTRVDPKLSRSRGSRVRTALLVLLLAGPVTGALLSLVEVVREGISDVTGISGVAALALSPDGRYLYAVGKASNSLAVFDAGPDALSFVEVHQDDDVNGVFGLLGASAVAVSPDCRHVYVTGEVDDTLAVFARQGVANEAAYDAGLGAPVCATTGRQCNSYLLLLGRDSVGPELNEPNTLDGCADGTLGAYQSEPSIEMIIVESFGRRPLSEGALARVDVSVWASTDYSSDYLDLYYAADATNPTWIYITTLQPSKAGKNLLSATYTLPAGSLQAVRTQYRRNGLASSCTAGSYNDHDDLVFAVAAEGACPANAALSFLSAAVLEDGVGGLDALDGASGVAVSGDDQNVYVTARNDDGLTVLLRDATQDELALVEAKVDGVGGVAGLNGAAAVAVSGDGKNVYVASELSDAVAIFVRDPMDGSLIYLTRVQDGVDTDGLNGASSIAISPDGAHVYVTGRNDSALVAFDRDSVTGVLTPNAVYRDGVDGVDGLNLASWVAINPSGNRVLVAGAGEDAVALFRRTPATGALALLHVLRDGVDGADGLAGVSSLVATDAQAFTAGTDEDAIARFYLALCEGDEATGDSDEDAFCDDVDLCTGDDLTGDVDGDGVCGDMDVCTGDDASGDSDSDGVCNNLDACPGSDDSLDADGDGVPDGCDVCLGDDATGDSDADGVCDDLDACNGYPDSADADGDGVPDVCDLCTGDDMTGDADGDGVCGNLDCAPADPNASEIICGVCGGDGTSCLIFSDGFESGSTSAWSGSAGGS